MSDPKFCIDCKFLGNDHFKGMVCRRSQEEHSNLVTGGTYYTGRALDPHVQRDSALNSYCGPGARYFQPKEIKQ